MISCLHKCIGPVMSKWQSVLSDFMLLKCFHLFLWIFVCILRSNGYEIYILFMDMYTSQTLWSVVFSNCHCLPKAVSIMKAALIHGYWDTYLKGRLVLCSFSKKVVALHFGPVDSPAMGFGKDLQYQAWFYLCEEGLKHNQKIVGCPYNNAPTFFFNPQLYFDRSDNSLDWEHSQFCAVIITIHLKNRQLC